jgi:hypothetical protein
MNTEERKARFLQDQAQNQQAAAQNYWAQMNAGQVAAEPRQTFARLSFMKGQDVWMEFSGPMPGWWRRFWTWALLGWTWTEREQVMRGGLIKNAERTRAQVID